jgi:hypothetical protein
MLTTARNSFLPLILIAAAACGGGTDDVGGDDPMPDASVGDEPDETAPTILSVSPDDGAVGQPADVVVSITFSEPMDEASVEGTLDHSDLGAVTISWNAAGDTITLTPDAELAYAEGIGIDPDAVDANEYSVILGNAAADLAGNELGTGTQITFATLKRLATTFDLDQELTRSLTANEDLVGQGDDPLSIGDLDTDEGVRSLITFDMSELGPTVTDIEAATFATRQLINDAKDYPYGDLVAEDPGLGTAVLIDHVSYAEVNNAGFNASQTAHASLGDFCIEGQVVIELDVTGAVADDMANRAARADRSQYLLRFALDNDEDGAQDRAVISRTLTELQVTYLAP